jgi:ATP-binding cassette subfamily B multidrug efflux pump
MRKMKKTNSYIIEEPDRIINYWKKEKTAVFWIVVAGIIYNVGMVFGPVFQGKLIDALNQKMSFFTIIYLAAVFLGSILIVQIFRYIKRFYIRRFANATSSTMRFMLYNNIVHKSEKQLQEENMGVLMTKAISDVDACVEGMRKFTTELFDTGVLLVTYLVTMLIYNVKITLISCIFIPVAMIIAEKLKTVIYRFTIAYRKKAGKITAITYDRIENAMTYRLYGREY